MSNQTEIVSYSIEDIHQIYDEKFIDLTQKIKLYNKNADIVFLRNAYDFAIDKHFKQIRKSGEPYFDHLFNVASILVELKLDIITITCGLLHDVLEDTETNKSEITKIFGDEVFNLVDGVTKINSISVRNQKVSQAENFRKMILSMSKDLRVILIKFADRLHNMRTLNFMPPEKRTKIANETLEVYAPLAHRFGLQKIKIELEDLCLKYLETEIFYFLKKKIEDTKEQRENYLKRTIEPISTELDKVQIGHEISGRSKHFYSIYNKMQKRNKPFEEIYDLIALRIIVEKVEQCYYALGIIHSLYLPVADRFKDYISMPKNNGYQSLHTTIIGPNGLMVEVQIRTFDMHIHAEEGIAAHWRYKYQPQQMTSSSHKSLKDPLTEHITWLKQFIERAEDIDSVDFFDNFKIDLFNDEIFVYTPKGDLLTLPAGATALDFAFNIHTDLGMHCTGAKINGRLLPLKTELKNGDTIQILVNKNQLPNSDWLNFTTTSKARHFIKKWIKTQESQHFAIIGQNIFQDLIQQFQIKKEPEFINEIMEYFNYKIEENFYAAIGRLDISHEGLDSYFQRKFKQNSPPSKMSQERVESSQSGNFLGINDLMISFGKCCNPIPGDLIEGYITTGRGITIHRVNCNNLKNLEKNNTNRIVLLNWNQIKPETDYIVHVTFQAKDRQFLLRDISNTISKVDVTVKAIDLKTDLNDIAYGKITIYIKDEKQLHEFMTALRKVQSIHSVQREDSTSLE